MHIAHAAFRKPSTRKVAVAVTSDRSNVSGEKSVKEVNAKSAGGWQTVSKKKNKNRGGKNKGCNRGAGQQAVNWGSNGQTLVGHTNAIVATATKGAQQQQQQQPAWRTQSNGAAGQAETQGRQN